MMDTVARYNNALLRCYTNSSSKLVPGKLNIDFITFFEGTDKEFIKKYHPLYPNYSFQILGDTRKPLRKVTRLAIEEFFKTNKDFQKANRDYNLNKLFI